MLVIKHEHFVKMTEIEEKRELLAFINKKIILKTMFNNEELLRNT